MNRVLLTQAFYQNRIGDVQEADRYESNAQKVGWKSYEIQILTFELATSLAGINWNQVKNVLDIGCGYGNFIKYLRERKNYQGHYMGVDIMSDFIQDADKLYGVDRRNKFILGDFLSQNWESQAYDAVFCLGALTVNHDLPHPYGKYSRQYAEDLIAAASRLALSAIVLHFPNEDNVSVEQRERNPDMAFYQPIEIEKMLRNATINRLQTIDIQSYPTSDDVRTIARLLLKS